MNPRPARLSFGLRSLFVLVFVVAVVSAYPFSLHVFAWLVWITGPMLTTVAFLVVRNATRSQPRLNLARRPTITGWLAFAAVTLPLLVSCFIRFRWVNAFSDDQWPRPFPYPDVYLSEIHDWWDRLHPITDGLKLHGEYYAVLQGINTLVLLACVMFGGVAGYVFRDGDFVSAARRLTWFLR